MITFDSFCGERQLIQIRVTRVAIPNLELMVSKVSNFAHDQCLMYLSPPLPHTTYCKPQDWGNIDIYITPHSGTRLNLTSKDLLVNPAVP